MTEKARKRIRPVIEEIVEESNNAPEPVVEAPPSMPSHSHSHHAHAHAEVAETKEAAEVETVSEAVEAPPVSEHPHNHHSHEEKARELLNDLDTTAPEKMNLKLIFALTIVTALVVGFISGGVYVYFTGLSDLDAGPLASVSPSSSPSTSPMTSSTPTPTPSATPVPTAMLATYKVSVLNGSGQVGGAGKVKALLENAGFKVGNTGNAASYNFTNTVVQVKDTVPADVIATIKKTLSSEYSVEVGKALVTSSPYDIIVTVGSK